MIPLTKDVLVQLNTFMSGEGATAIETLGAVIFEYYANQCTISEGTQLYRDQGGVPARVELA